MSRSLGGTRLTTLPPIAISPSEISSSPAIIRNSVDLPQPDGPTSTQNSPSAIAMSTPRMTCVDPKCLCTARMLTPAMNARFLLRLPGPGDDHVVGPARLEPGDDILRRLAPELALRLDRVEGGMRAQDDARVTPELRSVREGLDRQHVEREPGKRATIERGERGIEVDDRPARRVDKVAPRLHR